MISKILVWLFIVLNIVVFIGLPLAGYVLYNEAPPVNYSKREVLTKTVPPGGTLRISISADLGKKCEATVYRNIIDMNKVVFDLAPEPRKMETDYIVEVPIPLGAAPGMAFYSARIEWRCNIVQHWFPQEVRQRNLMFVISPSEGQFPIPEQQGIYQLPITKSDLAKGEVQ